MAARETTRVARAYFAALSARDVDAMVACWAPGGREVIRGMVDTQAPDGVREFFENLFAAVPDFALTVEDVVVQADRAVVRWTATGTFSGSASFKGLRPNGRRIELEGADVLTIREDLIVRNDAFTDSMKFARDIGLLPPEGSTPERGLFGAFNAGGRALGALAGGRAEAIADGVWIVRGGIPRSMNVYLVRDTHGPGGPSGTGGGGVLCFDAGIHTMVAPIRAAAGSLGGLTKVVLGHAHADHRGAAPGLGVPVWVHEADRADAEGDGGEHYFHYDRLAPVLRPVYPRLLAGWDGGPVEIARTLSEGDDVAGFRVVHLPGHAPGMIALWRESDRLALTSDCFYTLDPQTTRKGPPRVPHAAFNQDTDQARASIRKLAALAPASAWPGHAEPLRGDVRGQLEAAAAGS